MIYSKLFSTVVPPFTVIFLSPAVTTVITNPDLIADTSNGVPQAKQDFSLAVNLLMIYLSYRYFSLDRDYKIRKS